jgi:PilZ domain-containing protein
MWNRTLQPACPLLHYNRLVMKPRKRKSKSKEDSKPADQVSIHGGTQNLANPSVAPVEIEDSASYVELQSEIENLESSVEQEAALQKPSGSVEPPTAGGAPARRGGPVSSSPPQAEPDRRTHPRYAFHATAEVADTQSTARTKTRVRDLSQQGCYLDTDNPLPLGTTANVRMTKGAKSLDVQARVVFNQPGKGMGLMFTAVKPEHGGTLDSWIAESRETSWLAANRRRSQRVLMKIPVRISVQAGAASLSEEETYTLAVSAHGALLVVSAPLYRGQRLTLSNPQTKDSLECVVAHIDRFPNEQTKAGVEFLLPNPTFWHVAFPPKDWSPRHPDAKSPPR